MTLFALLLLVPALAFSALLIGRFSTLQREETSQRMLQIAADLANDIDRDHERNILLLRSFGLSGELHNDNYPAFHAEVKRALAGSGSDLILLDRDMKQLLNTGVTWGDPLPLYSAPEMALTALASKQPVVTGLFFGRTRERQVINVLLPIERRGNFDRILVLAYGPERLRKVIEDQYVGSKLVTEIIDRSDTVIARSYEHAKNVGKPLPPRLSPRHNTDKSTRIVEGLDGRPVIRATDQTRIAGWHVAAAIDRNALDRVVRSQWRDLALWGTVLLCLSLTACYAYGRSIELPLQQMVDTVIRSSAPSSSSSVREINDVASLLSASIQQVRESEERFRTFADTIDQVIWFQETGPDAKRYVSPAYATIWGRSTDEIASHPQSWLSAVHADDSDRVTTSFSNFLSGGSDGYDIEYRIVRPDGSERWIRDRGIRPADTATMPIRFSGIADDITKTKIHERELERYSVLLDRARDIKLVLSGRGRILDANNAASLAYGYTRAELIGLDVNALQTTESLSSVPGRTGSTTMPADGALYETWHRRKDGSRFPVEISASRADLDGQNLTLCVVRNIAQRREGEATLARYIAHQEVLLDVSVALVALGHDEGSLSRIVFDKVSALLDADVCITRRLNAQSGKFAVVFETGLAQINRSQQSSELAIDTTDLEASGEPLDMPFGEESAERLMRLSQQELTDAGLTAFASLPLFDGDRKLVGSFALGSTRRVTFTSEELVHLHAVANILSMAWERLAAERAVRQSAFQLRYAAKSAKLAYAIIDSARERVWLSDNFPDVVGYSVPLSPTSGLPLATTSHEFQERVFADDQKRVRAIGHDVLAGRNDAALEVRVKGDDGATRWLKITWDSGIAANSTRQIFMTLLDITARKHSEERVKLLMKEVNHRSKNLLGVVLALARHTGQTSDIKSFVSTLAKRIAGLSASQDLLVNTDWRGVQISDLVRAQLSLVRDLIDTRVMFDGPPALLTPAAAQAIGMALHELTTNAVKHGALSSQSGRISVEWYFTGDDETRSFNLIWSEHDGPSVTKTGTQGLGRRIMGKLAETALGGTVSINMEPAGITWKLVAPSALVIFTEGVTQPDD